MQLTVRTEKRQQLLDVTAAINKAVAEWNAGAVLVYVPHTTAGVIINEHADPDVARDILVALDRIVPDDGLYIHREGNSPAHVKASLVGSSQVVPIRNSRLALGTWQGVFFAEFDGPRTRTLHLFPLQSA